MCTSTDTRVMLSIAVPTTKSGWAIGHLMIVSKAVETQVILFYNRKSLLNFTHSSAISVVLVVTENTFPSTYAFV